MKLRYKLHLLILLLALNACSALTFLKASEAPNYGFLPKAMWLKKTPQRESFQRSWITKNKKLYKQVKSESKSIYIAPIATDIVEKNISKKIKDVKTRQIRIEEVRAVRDYFYHRLELAFKNQKNFKYELTTNKDPNSLVVSLALVEVEPTNPAVNALGTAAGFFVPGGGLIKIVGKGSVALEGFISTPNDMLLEQFKDREEDKAAPFTVKDFQQYAHIRTAIDDWSEQIAMIISNPIDYKVEDSLPFSLSPI